MTTSSQSVTEFLRESLDRKANLTDLSLEFKYIYFKIRAITDIFPYLHLLS
jgi:hypothetical protein